MKLIAFQQSTRAAMVEGESSSDFKKRHRISYCEALLKLHKHLESNLDEKLPDFIDTALLLETENSWFVGMYCYEKEEGDGNSWETEG